MAKQQYQKQGKPGPRANNRPEAKPKQALIPTVSMPEGGFLAGIIAAVLGLVLYLNTLGHEYTLDDFGAIKENWIVKGGLKNIGLIFSTEYRFGSWGSVGSLYRPIPLTMFAAEWQITQDNPLFYHAINVVLYAFTGWMMWIAWRRILSAYPPAMAAMTVLFFMAHPVHTEVVANIKSRDEILAMLAISFSLYALWRHFENNQTKWITWAVLGYAFALFSKESSITMLAIYPLTIWYFAPQKSDQIAKVTGLMFIPAVVFLLVRHQILAAQPYPESYSILDTVVEGAKNQAQYLATAFAMCWRYLQTLVLPHPLVHDMGYPQVKPVDFPDWRAMATLVVYGGMGIWALLNLKKRHLLAYAILFFLISFSIFSNVIMKIGTSYGERLLYMPSFGWALALAWAICTAFKVKDLDQVWKSGGSLSPAWIAAGVILFAYSLKTIVRNPVWKNSATLYAADLPTSPDCAKLNYHNALEVTKNGMDEKEDKVKDSTFIHKGIAAYTRCIELYPEYHDAYGSRGLAWFRLQQYDKALADYGMAVKHRPNDAKVLSNMGFIYFMRGQADKAEEVYRKSVQFDPRFVDARRNLGAVLAMQKKFLPAIEQWKEGLKYETPPKNAILYYYIGSAYKDMGNMAEAQPWFEKAYAINPALRK